MKKILRRILLLIIFLAAAAAAYIFLFPLEATVKPFDAPAEEDLSGGFARNNALADPGVISLDGYERPETILYRDGILYSSAHGKLLKTAEDGSGTELIYDSVNGETLGFDFDGEGNIIFCDARFNGTTPGIYKADLTGNEVRVTALCVEIDGKPLSCPDALCVAENGIIYFSDAVEFSPVKYRNADLAFQYESAYHSSNGKVCAYDPSTGEAWIVASGFSGANGIALSWDQRFLYVCETMEYSVWRIPVDLRNGTKGNGAELFLNNLPGYVDNLNRGLDGRYWVGLVSARIPSWDAMLGNRIMRIINVRFNTPADTGTREAMPETSIAAVFAFDDDGNILSFLMAENTRHHHVTGVCETDTRLYLHSNNYTGSIGFIEKNDIPG